ncbi:hypothetical protein BT96DRAFT_917665 [Gymnopus androsaceus JB14]|uniref:Histone deacetylase complex subunit SAP30 Sin3 binding domain-containing protein n=1 Tax=Gymnopus androsaceus JB14 TaxID=1447944 RepID=A0A6A4I366_9AGAR|nr:hypothetical protein BT96DRAFT_917665 [Gymnopus androsaceus JB14]
MSSVQSAPNRSRNQNRKKANEDASYTGSALTNSAGIKRQGGVLEGESSRAKRKKVEPPPVVHTKLPESENRISIADFVNMPSPFIYRYLAAFDLIPSIRPLPNSADEPPPPYSLGPNYRQPSPAPSPVPVTTPANRPRRDQKDQTQSRRRNSRLSEEIPFQRTVCDVHDLHLVLAGLAEKHFREMGPINGREEVDTLAAFIFSVGSFKGGRLR